MTHFSILLKIQENNHKHKQMINRNIWTKVQILTFLIKLEAYLLISILKENLSSQIINYLNLLQWEVMIFIQQDHKKHIPFRKGNYKEIIFLSK